MEIAHDEILAAVRAEVPPEPKIVGLRWRHDTTSDSRPSLWLYVVFESLPVGESRFKAALPVVQQVGRIVNRWIPETLVMPSVRTVEEQAGLAASGKDSTTNAPITVDEDVARDLRTARLEDRVASIERWIRTTWPQQADYGATGAGG